jgi:hypothetical protein
MAHVEGTIDFEIRQVDGMKPAWSIRSSSLVEHMCIHELQEQHRR